jgi:hypothetical protein
MTLEEFTKELEQIIAGLSSSGFDTIDSGIVEKLDALAAVAGDAGFTNGKHLIENLSGAMKAIKDGKSTAASGNIRLTALEFHLKRVTESGQVEDI